MSGGGAATEQASIEAGQRVQAKQGQGVADRVRIKPRIALEHCRDLTEQVVGFRQGAGNGILRGFGVHRSDDGTHAPLSCGAPMGASLDSRFVPSQKALLIADYTDIAYCVVVDGFGFRYLSYHATIRCSKSMLSAALFGGRWPPLT